MEKEVHLSEIDLNLLVALDALLEEANVTHAAKRMGLTQSAMSHALRRLRVLLGDDLLVRGRGKMHLTARAQELRGPVRRGLADLQRAISQPGRFEPATAQRKFVLGTMDYVEVLLLPHVLEILQHEAPHVDIQVAPPDAKDRLTSLEFGSVDLWIWVRMNEGSGILQRKLFDDNFACLVCVDHPDIQGSLSLEQYTAWPHMLVSPRGRDGSIVSTALEKRGMSRRIALQVPHFLSAPLLVHGSHLILTVSRRVANFFSKILPMQVLEPPLELTPYNVYMTWHERFQEDPAHQWLREVLGRAVALSEKTP